jgi:hypothetical protein
MMEKNFLRFLQKLKNYNIKSRFIGEKIEEILNSDKIIHIINAERNVF